MINPAAAMKVMKAKNQFVSNHPKFAAFFRNVLTGGVQEGTVIEITVTRPGEEPMTTNMRVQQSDIELVPEPERSEWLIDRKLTGFLRVIFCRIIDGENRL